MPFDGSGNYSPPSPPTFPAVSGDTISSAYFNATILDIATALSTALLRDGTSVVSADISFNSHKLLNVATPVAGTDAANKTYVDTAVTGLLDFKGSTDCSGNPNYPAASKGDAYIVSVAGKIGGASGISVNAGDMYFALADNAGGTQAAVGTSWDTLRTGTGYLPLTGGTISGTLSFDAGYYFQLSGGNSAINFDPNDYLIYDRTANEFQFNVASTPRLKITGTGIAVTGLTTFSAGADLTAPLAAPTTTEIGYMGSPFNTQNGNYTFVLTDRGKTIYHTSATPHNYTIPANASVAYPIGTIIDIEVESGSGAITLAITSDTLRWGGSSGSRTLTAPAQASIKKTTVTTWRLVGNGIT